MSQAPVSPVPRRLASALWLAGLLLAAPAVASAAEGDWVLVGQQGLVRQVIVPAADVHDRAAYQRQIDKLCEPERSCFVNFYTNSTGAALALPLPDAVANEAAATFRRSLKRGADSFVWSCRLQQGVEPCF